MSESRLVVTIDGSQATSEARRLEVELGKLDKAGTQAADSVGKVGEQSEQSVSKMDRLKGVIGTIGPMLAGLATVAVARTFVTVATETDRLRGQLETMVGSADKAGIAFKALEGFAAKTPFSLEQSVEAFVKLKALGLEPTERALLSFGNTSSAMSKSMTQMIEAVADASSFQFERLRDFGITAAQEGDKVKFTFRGLTTEVGKNSAEITEYLTALGENNFGTAMSRQMEGLPGLFSNLADEVTGIFRAFGDAGGNAVIAKVLKGLIAIADAIGKSIPIAMGYLRSAALSVFGALDESVTRLGYNVKILAQQFKKLWDPAARGEIERLTEARDAEVAGIRQMTAELKNEAVNAGYAANATADLADVVDESTAASTRNGRAVEDQTDKIKGLTAAQKERREDEMAAIMAKRESDLGLNETTVAIKSQTEALKESAAEMDPWTEALKGAAERVDSAFVDMWRNIGSGFDDFAGSLKDAFAQLLAELAHMAVTRPIVMQIGAALGLGGASGGAAGGASSLLSGGSILSKIPGIGGAFAPGGLAPLFGQWGVNSGVLKQTFGAGGMGPPQTSFSLAGAGMNLAAGYAGSKLTASLYDGRESTGYGSIAGGIAGSWFGPMGTFVGSAVGEAIDRALSGSDFSGKRVKLGIGTGSMVDGGDWENSRTLSSGLRVGNLTRRAGDAGLSDEQINGYLSAFDTLDSTLAQIARASGAVIDLTGKSLPGMVQNYDGGTSGGAFFGSLAKGELRQQMQDAPGEFVRQWIDATSEAFDAAVRPFLSRIDGTVEEMLGEFGAILDIQAQYKTSTDALKALAETDTIGLVTQQIEAANKSLFDMWADQGDAIVKFSTELADAEDYAQLTGMVQQRYATEIALIGQVMGALQQIDGIFASTIEGIKLDLMGGNDERYAYFEQQIEALTGSLSALTDPAAIMATLGQIDQLAGRSYGLLDDAQKQVVGQEIIDYLTAAEAIGTQRLEAVLDSVSADKQNEAGTVANAVQVSIDAASAKMVAQLDAVFVKQQAAADTLAGAANNFAGWVNYLPGSINVTLQTSEVNA